jgi:hypothetical protein
MLLVVEGGNLNCYSWGAIELRKQRLRPNQSRIVEAA